MTDLTVRLDFVVQIEPSPQWLWPSKLRITLVLWDWKVFFRTNIWTSLRVCGLASANWNDYLTVWIWICNHFMQILCFVNSSQVAILRLKKKLFNFIDWRTRKCDSEIGFSCLDLKVEILSKRTFRPLGHLWVNVDHAEAEKKKESIWGKILGNQKRLNVSTL
jgi:hypothetical protein